MNDQNQIKPVEIYAGSSWEVEMLKTILEDYNIKSFVKDEFIGSIAPHYSAGGVGAVKLLIADADLEKATPIVKEFEQNKSN
ncbi:putative signal transducing protein [Marinifilum sp. RC60d5]|uniref:putative signal transducing protein n=1 Tax=Marinifilum sp. RC60d5 TaxID=3458414 RepID=UPI0040355E67